jgi:hypothetical protein
MLVQKEIVMLQNSGGRMERRAKESRNNSSSAGIALILCYGNATPVTDSQGISEKE